MTIATAPGIRSHGTRDIFSITDRRPETVPIDPKRQSLRLLAYNPTCDHCTQDYAKYISTLIGSQLSLFESKQKENIALRTLATQASVAQDLVIFSEPKQSILARFITGSMACKAVEQIPASVLITRNPHWPIKKILLIGRGRATDNIAVEWAIRIAKAAGASIAMLAVLPQIPEICRQSLTEQGGFSGWATTDTLLGEQVRRITTQISNWEPETMPCFREGSPEWQLECEIIGKNYDLVIVSADPCDWWQRRLVGELVSPMLSWINRPLLVAKPII